MSNPGNCGTCMHWNYTPVMSFAPYALSEFGVCTKPAKINSHNHVERQLEGHEFVVVSVGEVPMMSLNTKGSFGCKVWECKESGRKE